MHTAIAIFISTCLLPLSVGATETDQPPYKPTESFLLNCGSSSNQTFYDEGYRLWEGDSQSKHFSSQSIQSSSSESTASEQDFSVPKVPYRTARIFHSKFTYSFYPMTPGQKFVRLYFYSATYSGLNISDSFFSVTAADKFVLLRNFSASLFASTRIPPLPYFVKEFIINVASNNQNLLNITFEPSLSSYAFINGIEIISVPENLYPTLTDKPITFVNNEATPFFFTDDTALENMYRLNVGGMYVFNINDTGSLFRTWIDDLTYIKGHAAGSVPYLPNVTIQYNTNTPAYTAPEIVYTTCRQMDPIGLNNTKYNLSWLFPVDAGFLYLVRLHFCETLKEVTDENQRVFFIYINSMTAEQQMDVIHFAGGSKIPMYRDYVVLVEKEQEGYLMLEFHPNVRSKPMYYNAILNGLEIFKLNQSDGNLAGPNRDQPHSVTVSQPKARPKGSDKRLPIFKTTFIPIVVVLGFVLGLFLCLFMIFHKRIITLLKKKKKEEGSSLPSDLCRHFTINEIRAATCDFDERLVIGIGGFGNVYRGRLAGADQVHVAVKRLNPRSKQGAREFRTEIAMLSKLRHVHLVSLIGYCDDSNEMILVYEYMPRGTLRDHLYGGPAENPALNWKRRLQICLGAARGLHYLHTGASHVIIHRDVKSTNILLDEKWVAKVSDFGLSRMGPTSATDSHVSTEVKGSFGYLDPEYCRRHQLTEKSDVYSFGVVLLEVLCARAAMGRTLPREQVGLANWAQKCYKNGSIEEIVDPNLKGQIAVVCLKRFAEIAVRCVEDDGAGRPSMGDVVGALEFAVELQQENDEKFVDGGLDDVAGRDRLLFGLRESREELFFSTDSGKGKLSEESGIVTSEFSSGGTGRSGEVVCLKRFAEIAVRCVEDDGAGRPSMGDVVGALEFAVELQQENDEKFVDGGLDDVAGRDRLLFGLRESREELFFSTDSGKGKLSEESGIVTSEFSSGGTGRSGEDVGIVITSDSELFFSES